MLSVCICNLIPEKCAYKLYLCKLLHDFKIMNYAVYTLKGFNFLI